MIQLQPREYFTIVRQLPDPGDVTVYYVRATIRNSRTDELIDTVALVDRGGQRFTQEWQVPADVSGLGFYLDITTNVFNDAAYTVPSTVYGRDNESFLVYDRISRQSGGGMSVVTDYKKINKMLIEALKPLEGKEVPELDLSPVLSLLKTIEKKVDGIEMPEMEKLELSPVIKAVGDAKTAVIAAIDKKEVTEETDLSPVLDAISGLDSKIEARDLTQQEKIEAYLSQLEEIRGSFEKMFKADYPDLAKQLDHMVATLREGFAYSTAVLPQKPDRVKSLVL